MRKAILDCRIRIDKRLVNAIRCHGVAGLFIEPEYFLVGLHGPLLSTSVKRNTALYHAHLSEESFEAIATSLAEGVGVDATARIQKVNKKTVLLVLAKAGEHAGKVSQSLLRNLMVSECQLDEMWSFVGKKEKNLDAAEKLQAVLGDAWIWIAFDAVNKVVISHVIGKRTLPHAVSLLEKVKQATTCMPDLFSSDQLDQYKNALLIVYGKRMQPERKPGPGRPPNVKLIPPKDLLYVQVVKEYKQNRVNKVTRKVVFGNSQKVDAILSASLVSHKINTSYVERNNGTIRHMDARCARKTFRFSKLKKNHKLQLDLSLAYYHLCRHHRTLTKRYGKPTTPFMAANLTDHVWSMAELLKYTPEDPCR